MGTAAYFSPEQAQGQNVDPRSDLYSLGAVLFEMVTGRAPFAGDSPVAIAYKHVSEAPPRPTSLNPAVPPALEAVIARLLAKNPAQRYASAEDLRADLRRFREGQPLVGVSTGPSPIVAGNPITGQTRPIIDPTLAVPAATVAHTPVPEEEYQEPPRRTGLFVAVLILLLLALGLLLFVILRNLDLGGDDGGDLVGVPNVVQLQQQAAEDALRELKLEPRAVFEVNNDVPAGEVFRQNPAAGQQVEPNSAVEIAVSQGPDAVGLPDVRGQSEADAVVTLTGLGFQVDRQRQPSADVAEGQVSGMSPEPNQQVNRGSRVTIIISTGPEEVQMPDVTRRTVPDATATLNAAGITQIAVVQEASTDVERGQIIRTDPGAGTSIPVNQRVTLTVSQGPAVAQVPTVTGLTQAAAEQSLINRGFQPVVQFTEMPAGDPRNGQVLSQNPEASAQAEVGANVTIVVGRAATATTTTTTTVPTTTTTAAPTDGD
jgi:serine/threonine-protein kinase